MTGDLGVEIISDSLKGKRVLYLVTGGIAAVDSVRVSRELRRHGAEINCMMTSDAKKIISLGNTDSQNEKWVRDNCD